MMQVNYNQFKLFGRTTIVTANSRATLIAGFCLMLLLLIGLVAGCGTEPGQQWNNGMQLTKPPSPSPVEKMSPEERNVYDWIVIGAREEVSNGVTYDASYMKIDYPGGDVPPDIGACTDVVVRAFRQAGIDLQKLLHEDMREHFDLYPQNWGLAGPDTSIDHRRVPNQMRFFARYGQSLPLAVEEDDLPTWQWGDVVYWRFSNGLEHCGIISDRKNKHDIPLVIHNAGKAREEDCLTRWEIIGHFRYPTVN